LALYIIVSMVHGHTNIKFIKTTVVNITKEYSTR